MAHRRRQTRFTRTVRVERYRKMCCCQREMSNIVSPFRRFRNSINLNQVRISRLRFSMQSILNVTLCALKRTANQNQKSHHCYVALSEFSLHILPAPHHPPASLHRIFHSMLHHRIAIITSIARSLICVIPWVRRERTRCSGTASKTFFRRRQRFVSAFVICTTFV